VITAAHAQAPVRNLLPFILNKQSSITNNCWFDVANCATLFALPTRGASLCIGLRTEYRHAEEDNWSSLNLTLHRCTGGLLGLALSTRCICSNQQGCGYLFKAVQSEFPMCKWLGLRTTEQPMSKSSPQHVV
jgi:hypothetical protein